MIVKELTLVSDDERLAKIKSAGGMGTATHLNETLTPYMIDIMLYMLSAGVAEDVVKSTLAIGCITRGVLDTWNYGNGDTEPSEYFYQKVNQLKKIEVEGGSTYEQIIAELKANIATLETQLATLTDGYNALLIENEALRAENAVLRKDAEELAEIDKMIDESGVLAE